MRTLAILLMLTAPTTADDIIAFTRPGCGPCESFKADYAKDPKIADPHKLHVMDSRSELGGSYGVKVVPTFIRLKDGVEAARKVGYAGKSDLRYWLER
jgi:thiol-disulfide isomerase/thioredoxin